MNLNICKHSGYTITTVKEVAVSNISQTLKKSIWIVGDPQMEADGNKQVVSTILKAWTSYPKPWGWDMGPSHTHNCAVTCQTAFFRYN